jgi:hypothetical protein
MTLAPFRGFYDVQSEMNRALDEVFCSLGLTTGRQQGGVQPDGHRHLTCSRKMETL